MAKQIQLISALHVAVRECRNIMANKNRERRSANICLIIISIGVLAAILPFILDVDMWKWGFGVSFSGGMVTIIVFFVFLMYLGRAKVWDRIFNSENILAHWYYSKKFWQGIYNEDMKDSGTGKIFGYFFGVIFSLIGIIVFAIDTKKNEIFLFLMLGIAVFFIIIGYISAGVEKKRVKSSLPEVIIAKDGLFYKDILYTWNAKAVSYLESVTMHPVESDTLLFVLRHLSGGGINMVHHRQFFIPVPIPEGQLSIALIIIEYFNLPMSKDNWDNMKQRT